MTDKLFAEIDLISIREIQGDDLKSPFASTLVRTSGVVTGVLRRGFFLQTPDKEWDGIGSDAVFVYSPDWKAERGAELDVIGECIDFVKHETAKPVTQVHLQCARVKSTNGQSVTALELNQGLLPAANDELAVRLNALEGMLLRISAGHTFIAPSNRYGDYVLVLNEDAATIRTEHGGVVLDSSNPLRWFPGFRVTNYNHAKRLNVGAKLKSDVTGPLNYRVDAYQLSVNDPFEIDESFVSLTKSSIKPSSNSLSIMTLNCFNLDPHIESESLVMNPNQDVDDDWGEGRFHTLAQAVVLQANIPDIVALQEIQDNDGAELSEVVDAADTYNLLIKTIEQLSGVRYKFVDIAPEMGADGGQPGGNIRNGYLYNPARVAVDESSVRVFGADDECFAGSRKPLSAEFIEQDSKQRLVVINVHLASKRHQESIFSPINPGVDAKLSVRVSQATRIRQELEELSKRDVAYYVTGDFNDTEHSETLTALLGGDNVNLVESLSEAERFDYNHRGKLQVLMHGIVPKHIFDEGLTEYEIIHGNELIGVAPGEESNKPSDHAYVLAKLRLKD